MSSYLVLARKYRSQGFDQLIGQEGIVSTLLTAIKLGRVAHAYLFTGTRGVGKTSSARLFADAINNPGKDPAIHKAILSGQDTDTIEIDAASNSSVDQARELIAGAVYAPMRGHKKIYIIDECHMLSTAAFNALLKTMEEPPEHVIFILCTTETHKVPATIQSRCQRFDFRNIPVPQIARHLTDVLKKEGFSAEEELLFQVARLGNGSMRDALSLLDRLIAAGEKNLTLAMLERLLGLPDREIVIQLVDALGAGDAAQALDVAGAMLTRGVSIDQFLTTLAERFRDLMVIAACGPDTSLVELSEESRKAAVRQAARFDAAGLVHMIALVESVAGRAKSSSFPRALVDALVVRLAMTERFADVTALVAGNAGAAVQPRPGASPVTTPSRTVAPAKKP